MPCPPHVSLDDAPSSSGRQKKIPKDRATPKVLFMAMPCTGFSELHACFAQAHPESFRRALFEGNQTGYCRSRRRR